MNERKADFILKGEEVIYPEIPKDGLELYYDIKGKTNQDLKKNEILDMSGKGRHAALTGFAYSGRSGYYDGLVFDEIDDTLARPAIAGLDPNNLTYQVNGNIVRFKADGTSQMVKDGEVVEIGRNLLTTNQSPLKEFTGAREFINTYDLAPIFDVHGLIPYTISFDIKSKVAGSIQVYMQNGAGARYFFAVWIDVTQEWERKSVTITPKLSQPELTQSMLAFYGIYDSGRIPTVRAIKVEKGSVLTPYTPSPEDLASSLTYSHNVFRDLENVIDDMDLDTKTGESVTFEGYKDNHIDVTVEGNTVQSSDWYAKDGLSTQYQDTKVMGKNLFNNDAISLNKIVNGGGGVDTLYNIAQEAGRGCLIISVTPNTTYTIKTNLLQLYVRGIKSGMLADGVAYSVNATQTLTTGANTIMLGINLRDIQSGLNTVDKSNIELSNIQVELDSVATTYEPYKDSVKNGLVMELSGRNFFNSPQTTSLKDRSGNGNHGTPIGFSYTTTSGSDGNGGIVFDGVDDYVYTPASTASNGNHTIEGWFKFSVFAKSRGVDVPIFGNIFYQHQANNYLYIWGTADYFAVPLNLNTLYHIVLTYNGDTSTAKLYVNNVQYNIAQQSVSHTVPAYGGHIGLPANSFGGTIYLNRVYNRALSASEVYQNYMAGTNLNMPAPEDPSPVVSNLPAGTYKYTSTDGIYEFTLDEELRGIGASLDRIVFDRVSKQGKLERVCGTYNCTGIEPNWLLGNVTSYDTKTSTNRYLSFTNKSFANNLGYCNQAKLKLALNGSWTNDTYHNCFSLNANYQFHLRLPNELIGVDHGVDDVNMRTTKFKLWLKSQADSGKQITLVYVKLNSTTTPLTFTKVASSTKTEVPMTFLTATPSLDYPAQVWDSVGNVVGRGKNLAELTLSKLHSGVAVWDGEYLKITREREGGGYIDWTPTMSSSVKKSIDRAKEYTLVIEVVENTFTNATVSIGGGYSPFSWSIYFNPLEIGIKQQTKNVSNGFDPDKIYGYFILTNLPTNSVIGQYIKLRYSLYESGSNPMQYEPYISPFQATLPTLRKIGTVADTYNTSTGVLTKRISDWVVLDGSKSWVHSSHHIGFKRLYLGGFVIPANNVAQNESDVLAYKYDSIPLTIGNATGGGDRLTIRTGGIDISVFMENTGFSDAYQSTGDEAKAYFYGWKMCNADGTSPYYKSEVPYNPTTWAEWGGKIAGRIVGDSTGLELIADGTTWTGSVNRVQAKPKPSTKYGFLFNVISSTLQFNLITTGGAFNYPSIYIKGSGLGNMKAICTTSASVTDNIGIQIYNIETAGNSIKLKDIRIFELPTGSQIETDFNTLTADQLAAKYTFNGLCAKNWKKVTDGTGQTSTLPTASYEGYTPYKMIYQLATPVTTYLAPNLVPTYYPTTVIETDSPSYCKPAITAKIKAIDYLKERRTINNMLLWSRALSDPEILKQYRLFHERYRMKSPTVNGVPIEGFVWIEGGANIGSTVSTDMTIYI